MQYSTDHVARPATAHPARLLVDDVFDGAFADDMARLESYNKHHYRPNSYLHKWWARRCGSTFRLILKHLVEDEARRDYYAPGGLEGKVVLDPMMGGGTTLHEAIRMGASVIGADIDPIPILQARATLSQVPLAATDQAFRRLYEGMEAALSPYYLTTCPHCDAEGPLRFVLYGSRRRCACGPTIVVDSLVLRYEKRKAVVSLCPRCHDVLDNGLKCRCNEEKPAPLIEKPTTQCPCCSAPYKEDLGTPFFARYAPVVIVGQCAHDGLFFARPKPQDLKNLARADAQRGAVLEALGDGFCVEPGPKARDLLNHGVTNYTDLFSSRQLLTLHHALQLLPQFDEPLRLNLALLLSTSLEFNSMLCGYKGAVRGNRPGAIRHAFSYHAYSFPYTALENNALFPAKASGTLQKLYHDRLWRAKRWARQPRERQLSAPANGTAPRFVPIRGERDIGQEVRTADEIFDNERAFLLQQGSAASLPLPDASVDFIVTDPPYYDNVQYSDLAAFFRVWLPRLISEKQNAACEWRYDQSQAAVDSFQNGSDQYGRVLGQIFAECGRVLKPEGRLIFTFHHWKPQSWAALTLALKGAGFRLVNRYAVHSENPISVHVANLRAITDDAILVLAPAEAGVHGDWSRPAHIDKSASRQFCSDCATLLGWMLAQEMAEREVRRVWRVALKEG